MYHVQSNPCWTNVNMFFLRILANSHRICYLTSFTSICSLIYWRAMWQRFLATETLFSLWRTHWILNFLKRRDTKPKKKKLRSNVVKYNSLRGINKIQMLDDRSFFTSSGGFKSLARNQFYQTFFTCFPIFDGKLECLRLWKQLYLISNDIA